MDIEKYCTHCLQRINPFGDGAHDCKRPEEMSDRELMEDTNRRLRVMNLKP